MFTITNTDGLPIATAPTLGLARETAERRSREYFGDLEVRDRHGDAVLRYRDGTQIGSVWARPIPVRVVR